MNQKSYKIASKNANSVIDLEFEARKMEDWLLDNVTHRDFDKKLSKYNGILFSMANKKEFDDNLEKGVEMKIYDLPLR